MHSNDQRVMPATSPALTLTPSIVKLALTSRLLNCKKVGTCIFYLRISCNHNSLSSPDISSSLKWRMDPVHVLGVSFFLCLPFPHPATALPGLAAQLTPHIGLLSGQLLRLKLFSFLFLFPNSIRLTMATLFLLLLLFVCFLKLLSLH